MSDLGTPATEGPVDPRTGKPTVIDPVAVWDEAAGAPATADAAQKPAIEGSFEVQGFAVKPVYQVVKESISEYTVERAADICDSRRSRSRNWPACMPPKAPCTS